MDLSQIPIEWLLVIPPRYLALLVLFFGSPVVLSAALSVAKRITGVPKPSDGVGKRVWFKALSIGDALAVNSPTIKCQLQAMQQRQALAAQQRMLSVQERHVQTQAGVIRELQK